MDHETASGASGLCQTCQNFDLRGSYFEYGSGDDAPDSAGEFHLGTLSDIIGRQNCPLCRLALSAIGARSTELPDETAKTIQCYLDWEDEKTIFRPTEDTWNYDLGNWQDIKDMWESNFDYWGNYKDTWKFDPNRTVDTIPHDAIPVTRCIRVRAEPWMDPMNESDLITTIPDSEKPFLGREWKQDHIDFDLVKSWIFQCRKIHLGDDETILPSEGEAGQIAHFKLIDVQDMCIVDASSHTEYIALSYVWGTKNTFLTTSKNISRLRERGALSDLEGEIPATIRDAMLLVSRLSFRYLWIDSLCIVQDDSQTKSAAINAMDVIYSRSLFTIIAASGNDANSGLSGVRPGSRSEKQNIEVVRGVKLLSITHLDDYLSNSVYDTRAWTFQERHLSNRILFLVGGQAIWQCSTGTYREDITSDPAVPAEGFDDFENYRINILYVRRYPDKAFVEYMALVHHYSARHLSYDGDILNAFKGVSKVLSTVLQTTFHWGLPVSLLDWALLWEAKGYVARRTHCPSWSWTGWKGNSLVRHASFQEKEGERRGHLGMPTEDSSDGDYTFDDLQQWLKVCTWIVWYRYESLDDNPIPIPKTPSELTGGNNRFAGIDCTRTLPAKKIPKDLEIFPRLQQSTAGAPILRPGRDSLLHFWTISAYFRLGDLPDDYEPDELATSAGLRCYGLYDKDGVASGDVWVCDDWEPPSSGICQLLVLSEGLPFYNEYEEYKIETYEANAHLIRGGDDGRADEDRAHSETLNADSIIEVDEVSESGSGSDENEGQVQVGHLFNVLLVQPVSNSHSLPLVERIGHGKLFRDALNYSCDPRVNWEEILLV